MEFPGSTILRTRNPEEISKADIVVDVGTVYDPARMRFDHHQLEGAGMRENGIPYASFGLVWKEFGEKLAGGKREADRVDRVLVQPMDAIDNGTAIAEHKFKNVRDYDIGDFLYSYVTSDLKPDEVDKLFLKLAGIAGELLGREIVKAKEAVKGEDALRAVYAGTEDKRLIELPYDEKLLPWKRILGEYLEPLYVIYPRSDGRWGLKAVPDPDKPYGHNRKNLPASWAGKSGEELERITGVSGAVFAHRTLFMAAAKTREAILKLAELALKN